MTTYVVEKEQFTVSENVEIERRPGLPMKLVAASIATLSLATAGCTREQIMASMEYCSTQPDVEHCLGQMAALGSGSYLDGGQVTDKVKVMQLAGIDPHEYDETDAIIDQESGGWCFTRWQNQFGPCPRDYVPRNESAAVGYGLTQATPPKKMESAGPDWRKNPVTQMRWFKQYCISRYGSITAAYRHKRAKGYY